ncbi:hypothetical protein EVD20_02080 [Elizabethkingia bruuniana]|nr:hypothetical protein [Elizabethkingia bruuniana]QDZ61937.1 hypothetical protein EVD20_02080 [Elizabethkingia bruuniana]
MDIDDTKIKTQLLIHKRVIPNWSNVIEYYTLLEKKITDILINFLNSEDVYSKLLKEKLLKENKDFEISLIKCNELSVESYNSLLNSTYYNWNSIDFDNLNVEKALILLNKKLNTTKSNYDLLREHFPNNHIILIEKDFKKFIENISEFETDENDVLLLLKSNKISLENKFYYITKLDESTITLNKETSKLVGEIILQKSKIIELSIDTLKHIVVNLLREEKRILLINLYFEKITNDDIIDLLKSIWNYDNLFKNRKPTFDKTEYNRILLERLKAKGLIKNYYDNKWNDKEFRVTTNY